MNDSQAAINLAAAYSLSVDSLRGRLSRANTPTNWARVNKYVALTVEPISPSVARQKAVVANSVEIYEDTLARLPDDKWHLGVFVSDAHAPYTRWDAWNLTLQLIEKLQPAFVSGQNDFVDNAGFGRWDDTRTAAGRVWGSDVANLRALEVSMYNAITSAAPDTTIVGVAGNHDLWYPQYLRKEWGQAAEQEIANYMELMQTNGVLLFNCLNHENAVQLSPGLVWWHGQFTSRLPTTNASNTLGQFMADGVAASVTVGHTHRPVHIPGVAVKLPGVDFWNSPCLSRIEQVPYLKRDPKGWKLGITLNYFKPRSRAVRGTIIIFEREGGELAAYYDGMRFATPLDIDTPDDYA